MVRHLPVGERDQAEAACSQIGNEGNNPRGALVVRTNLDSYILLTQRSLLYYGRKTKTM